MPDFRKWCPVLGLVAGCASSTSPPVDMKAPADLLVLSSCGHPGDTGNSLGVGKFCMTIADCTANGAKTNICSAAGNGLNPSPDDTYFCTIFPCHPDGGATLCGENASCACDTGGTNCACTPDSCLGPTPDGGATD
jgi:hypothetical protein